MDLKILPSDWIYDNIFHFSEDQYDEYRDLILEDQKRSFRLNQVANEGNDPLESGKSYGTPHDLATIYGKDRAQMNADLPVGYSEKPVLGRPEEKASYKDTQQDPLGMDRLGRSRNKDVGMDSNPVRNDFKGASPLALESTKTAYLKNKKLLESIDLGEKKLVFEGQNTGGGLLDESQIKDLE